MIILLPLPNPKLCGNGKPNWAEKARLVERHRYWAKLAVHCDETVGPVLQGLKTAKWRATWYFPDARRRDVHNYDSSLKSYLDGFTDAGVWADDNQLQQLTSVVKVDKKSPRVEIEITVPE